jgi:hypothetical protein
MMRPIGGLRSSCEQHVRAGIGDHHYLLAVSKVRTTRNMFRSTRGCRRRVDLHDRSELLVSDNEDLMYSSDKEQSEHTSNHMLKHSRVDELLDRLLVLGPIEHADPIPAQPGCIRWDNRHPNRASQHTISGTRSSSSDDGTHQQKLPVEDIGDAYVDERNRAHDQDLADHRPRPNVWVLL